MMDWFPIVFVTFKVIVLSIGMFFAVKWHYDKAKKKTQTAAEARAMVLRAGGKVAIIFILLLLCLGIATFFLVRALGVDLVP